MISKKRFIEIINELEELDNVEEKVNEVFKESSSDLLRDFGCFTGIVNTTMPIVLELLEYIFNDDTEDISWWYYEADCGRNKNMKIYDEDKNEIDVSTAGKFYNYLTNIKNK